MKSPICKVQFYGRDDEYDPLSLQTGIIFSTSLDDDCFLVMKQNGKFEYVNFRDCRVVNVDDIFNPS